jgi:hypothetical protein
MSLLPAGMAARTQEALREGWFDRSVIEARDLRKDYGDKRAGDVTVNGRHYREHVAPLHEVGALVEARSVHTDRSAYNHLLALAHT